MVFKRLAPFPPWEGREPATARPAETKSDTFILLNSGHDMKIPVENHPQGRCLLLLLRICFAHLRIFGFLRNCLLIKQRFCAVYDYVEKADLSKGYQNPKRKLGVTAHFSEITELKFGKKLPYILCILTLFENYGCLIIYEKCVVVHIFLFGFQ